MGIISQVVRALGEKIYELLQRSHEKFKLTDGKVAVIAILIALALILAAHHNPEAFGRISNAAWCLDCA